MVFNTIKKPTRSGSDKRKHIAWQYCRWLSIRVRRSDDSRDPFRHRSQKRFGSVGRFFGGVAFPSRNVQTR